MKKKLFLFLPFICLGMAFADANITLPNNQTVNLKYDEKTPDIWITTSNGKTKDSYKIEVIGAGSNIESVSTDFINGRNVLLAEINLGESGGQINIDKRILYVFEFTKEGKIKLLVEEPIIDYCYEPYTKKTSKFQFYYYVYEAYSKEVIIYDSHNFMTMDEVKRIRLNKGVK